MKKIHIFLGSLLLLLMLAVTLPVIADSLDARVKIENAFRILPNRAMDWLCAATADCTAETDLMVSKAIHSSPVAPGKEIEYQISFENAGNAAARNVVITDVLPDGVTYVSDYNEYGFTTASTGSTVVWTRPALNPGESGYLYLRGQVATSPTVQPGDSLINVVQVATSDLDMDPGNDVYTNTLKVVEAAVDVFVEKSSPVEAPQGEEMTYQIHLGNFGNDVAPDIIVTDTLPVGVTFVSSEIEMAMGRTGAALASGIDLLQEQAITPTVSDNQVVWNFGTMAFGSSGYIYLTVHISDTVSIGDVLTNVVQIATSAAETNTGNNSDLVTSEVYAPTRDMAVSKSLYSGTPTPGNELKYQISFSHVSGNAPARDVVITDTLPPGTTFVSWSSDSWSTYHYLLGREIEANVSDNQIVWPLGTVELSEIDDIYLTVRITDTVQPGVELANVAQVTTGGLDPVSRNNVATQTTIVESPAWDMGISKSLYSSAGAPGGEIKYGLYFGNYGNAMAHDVVITDTLPPGTTLVSWSAYSSGEGHWLFGREVTEIVSGDQVVWPLGSVEASNYDYIYLTLRISDTVPVGTVLTNTVQVSTSDSDGNVENDSDTLYTTVVSPMRDVVLVYKQLDWSSKPPVAGGVIKYEIKFRNDGNMPASNVVITDDLPANATLISWSGSAYNPYVDDLDETVSWAVDGDRVVWYLGTIEAGQYGYIKPTVHIADAAQARDVLCNRASISSDDVEDDPGNNAITHTLTVYAPTYDMHVMKQVAGLAGAPGGEMKYQIYFENEGHATAQNVVITDILPPGVTFVSWSGYAVNPYVDLEGTIAASVNGNQVSWLLGEIAAEQYGSIYVTVRIADTAKVGDVLTNTVQISSDEDWDPTDDSSTLATAVSAPVMDLSVYKSIDCVGAPGGEMRYYVSVDNGGNVAATNVVLTDTLPPNTTLVSWSGGMDAPTVDGNQVVWHMGTISAGRSIYFDILVHVSEAVAVGTELTNEIQVSSDEVDIDLSNNSSTDTTVLTSPKVDVAVSKSNSPAMPGELIEYYINFFNYGSIEALDVTITDTLPLSVSYSSWTGFSMPSTDLHKAISPTIDGNQIVWHLGSISGCVSGHIYLHGYVSSEAQVGDVLVNVVEISTSSADVVLTNNVFTATTTVQASTPSCIELTSVDIIGPTSGQVGETCTFNAVIAPFNASKPITYTWTPEPDSGQGGASASYTWTNPDARIIRVTAENCDGKTVTDWHAINIGSVSTIDPAIATTLTYTNEQGYTTTLTFPAGVVIAPSLVISYTPLSRPGRPISAGLRLAGRAIDLDVSRPDLPGADISFLQPVTLTIHYSDRDVAGIDESTLALYRWIVLVDQWRKVGDSIISGEAQWLYPEENLLVARLRRFSAFGKMGVTHPIFLPVVLRNS